MYDPCDFCNFGHFVDCLVVKLWQSKRKLLQRQLSQSFCERNRNHWNFNSRQEDGPILFEIGSEWEWCCLRVIQNDILESKGAARFENRVVNVIQSDCFSKSAPASIVLLNQHRLFILTVGFSFVRSYLL